MSFPKRGFLAGILVLMIVTAPSALTPTAEGQLFRPVRVEVANESLNVDVLNDTLNEPYNQTRTTNVITGASAEFTFDVPAGKRLIIETITVSMGVQAGQNGRANVRLGGSIAFLSVQSQGAFGSAERLFGTHPVKMRVDGSAATDEIKFEFVRDPSTGAWAAEASVHGYLVPLPTP